MANDVCIQNDEGIEGRRIRRLICLLQLVTSILQARKVLKLLVKLKLCHHVLHSELVNRIVSDEHDLSINCD